jgi:hypothetical protein
MRIEHQAEKRRARPADPHHEGHGRALRALAPGDEIEDAHLKKRLEASDEAAPELGIALDVGEHLGAERRRL